jgi:hypothetical protein
MALTASSAVNLPITSASLGLGVVRMGVRSIRCTYSVVSVPPRFTLTINFVFFMVCHCFWPLPYEPVRRWKQLKEVLATHGHRNSSARNPEFPSFREADTQLLF